MGGPGYIIKPPMTSPGGCPMGVAGEPLAGGDHHLAGKWHLSGRLGGGVLLLRAGLKPLHVHALWVRLLHVLWHPMHRRWASPRLQSTRGMLHDYTSSTRTVDLTSTSLQNAWREYKLMSQLCYKGPDKPSWTKQEVDELLRSMLTVVAYSVYFHKQHTSSGQPALFQLQDILEGRNAASLMLQDRIQGVWVRRKAFRCKTEL